MLTANLIDAIFAFSHTYCVAICAVLVPWNLLTTVLTLGLVSWQPTAPGLPNFPRSRQLAIAAGIGGSILMVLHVLTWFVVGVIQVQTFILFSLGVCCISLNLWALGSPTGLRTVLLGIWQRVFPSVRPTVF